MDVMKADLVLTGANVITVDERESQAQAVAVKDGIIVAVGRDDEVAGLIGGETRVLDLAGKTVVPGFNDTHTHNCYYGEFRFSPLQLNVAAELNPSIAELQAKLSERAATTPKGQWIGGRNYDPNGMAEKRWITRAEIDAVCPHNPVLLWIRGGHACVANSPALQLAGIDESTPNPAGGTIEVDPATGKLNGVLRDVMEVREVLPRSDLQDIKAGLKAANDMYLKLGITSVGDAGALSRHQSYRAYQEASAERLWNIRTYLMIRDDWYQKNDLGLRTGFGDERLRLGAMKFFMDGSIQVFTCAFHEPYVTRDTRGMEGLRYSERDFEERVTEMHHLGYQIAVHAQGDYGINRAINALERAMAAHPRPDPRHRIEHALCPRMDDLERMKRLGIIPNFFVSHTWFWGDQHIDEFIGPERASRMVPVKTALKMGLKPCAHSDAPVCTPDDPVWPSNPLWGMWCQVNRKTRSGRDIGPDERLTPLEALRVYTINGAHATFEEGIKGSIEPGKLADMVVLAEDPLTVDPEHIRDIVVEKTLIGGDVLYEHDG